MKKKLILITWWTWYIGSHAVVSFYEAGYEVVIVDNLVNSSEDSLDNIEKIIWIKPKFHNIDLRDKKSMEDLFKEYDFHGVIHFAWLKAVWESCEKPMLYYDNNIGGSLVLFELMEKYEVKNIIFSSSATVYSSKNTSPLDEQWELDSINPYGYTKLIIEYMLKWLAENKWFNVVLLRYFNPIWAHSSGYIWEKPDGIPNNLLPYIMDVASAKREYINIFWNDYDTIDGTGVRDYIHVVDLVEGHLKAYNLIIKQELWINDWFWDVFNLGTGKGTSVLDMIKTTEKVTERPVPYQVVDRRKWDLAEVYCNPSKAREVLGWEAKLSVEDWIRDSWKFNGIYK